MSTMEANDDKPGALLVPRLEGAWCLLAGRWADSSNPRPALPSGPEGGAGICFPSRNHHIRVSLKAYCMHPMTTVILQCEEKSTASPKKSEEHLVLETGWGQGEGAGVKPGLAGMVFLLRGKADAGIQSLQVSLGPHEAAPLSLLGTENQQLSPAKPSSLQGDDKSQDTCSVKVS